LRGRADERADRERRFKSRGPLAVKRAHVHETESGEVRAPQKVLTAESSTAGAEEEARQAAVVPPADAGASSAGEPDRARQPPGEEGELVDDACKASADEQHEPPLPNPV